MKWVSKNPVLAFSYFVALYGTALAQLRAENLVPNSVLEWLIFGGAVLTTALGLVVHNIVTPVAAPRDNDGNALVPAIQSAAVVAPAPIAEIAIPDADAHAG